MKVTCPKDELTRALAVVGRAVSTRASVQVLGGVLLHGGEGRLHLAATDMELSLRLSVEAQVEGQGAVVAPWPSTCASTENRQSPPAARLIRRLMEEMERAGSSTARVLIQGEHGTGKELVARALHAASPRRAST